MSALDASAILALLRAEPGADIVAERIAAGATVSTVNLAEVATVLTRTGHDAAQQLASLFAQVDVSPFDVADALAVGALEPVTRPAGLSLGDRACLALARRLRVSAVTADHAWTDLDHSVTVDLIRQPS